MSIDSTDVMNKFCEYIFREKAKDKIPFVIYGSGISSVKPANVPSTLKIVEKLLDLTSNENDGVRKVNEDYSSYFQDMWNNLNRNKKEAAIQTNLINYIQNAYLGLTQSVDKDDIKKLPKIWGKFLEWLINQNPENSGDEDFHGLIYSKPTETHNKIREFCEKSNALVITTNFDNLLKKSFLNTGKKFLPILSNIDFENYFTRSKIENKNSETLETLEIQTRGDVFWIECTGNVNPTCQVKGKRVFIPDERYFNLERNDTPIVKCSCGSEAKVYFAFPGTREKDREMRTVISGLWKFIAYRCSAVILLGSSLDYDPVLLNFIRELIKARDCRLLCLSRVKKTSDKPYYHVETSYEGLQTLFNPNEREKIVINPEDEVNGVFSLNEFIKNENKSDKLNWVCSKNVNQILDNLNNRLDYLLNKDIDLITHPQAISENKNENERRKGFGNKASADYYNHRLKYVLMNYKKDKTDNESRNYAIGDFDSVIGIQDIIGVKKINEISYYSQLGLKTYWYRGISTGNHDRLNHSRNVMAIASYIYLRAKKIMSLEELQFLQLAALCHDLGHLPFSHLFEEIFSELGWLSIGEKTAFDHESNTDNIINKMYNDPESTPFKIFLDKTGYTTKDLTRLIHGEFGVGYLDVIINSPIDADKMEYTFSDGMFNNTIGLNQFENFIDSLCNDINISPDKFLIIKDETTNQIKELLKLRSKMYEELYLDSGLRYLESCCKLIIKTYINYKCTEKENIFAIAQDSQNSFFDISNIKKEFIINDLKEQVKKLTNRDVPPEISLIENMVEYLNNNYSNVINSSVLETINSLRTRIINSKGPEAIRNIKKSYVRTFEISKFNINKASLDKPVKDLYMRFPGVIAIDYVQSKGIFSFSESGKIIKRMDGTEINVENILVKNIRPWERENNQPLQCFGDSTEQFMNELSIIAHEYIHLYRLTEDRNKYMLAEDYALYRLRKLGVKFEER